MVRLFTTLPGEDPGARRCRLASQDGDGDRPAGPDAWTHISAARSPRRARARRWLAAYFGQSFEIRGDRCGGVDPACAADSAATGRTIAYIAQAGVPRTAAGFRTATACSGWPRVPAAVLTSIDAPARRPPRPMRPPAGRAGDARELLVAMASSQVPITFVVIGEGVSGGALALASPTDLWIARDGYLAVTAPELAVSIIKLGAHDIPSGDLAAADPGRAAQAGESSGASSARPRAQSASMSPVRRLTQGNRAPRGRLRERSVFRPGQPRFPPRTGPGQREVTEISQMADAERLAGQPSEPAPERHVVAVQDQPSAPGPRRSPLGSMTAVSVLE